MQESYGEGVANYTGPESCVAHRKGRHEALTGGETGQDMEPRNVQTPGRRRLGHWRKATSGAALARAVAEPCAVVDPSTCGNITQGNREIPGSPEFEQDWGRVGKSKDRIR